ncbi:MAG TPA: Arc family DNA-binding protein [bacterium]
MSDLLIRRVPEAIVRSLKRRARRHRRSLQQELVAILESAADHDAEVTPERLAAVVRLRLARGRRQFSDSAVSIRRDRTR